MKCWREKNASSLAWLTAYQRKSKFTWRKARTFPNSGKIYVFQGHYKCHHNTNYRFRRLNKRISKHTGCEATLKIKVKRYLKRSKSQHPDVDAKEYPCIVILDRKHNHGQFDAEVLRFRDIAETTTKKLLYYYQQGFSASCARRALKENLLLSEENFEIAESDASLLPSLSVIQHLFNKKFSAADGTKDDNPMEFEVKKEESHTEGVKMEKTSQLQRENKKMLLDELNHDLTLKVGDKEIHVHQDVLRAQSRVFESMLSHDIIKKNHVVIEVYDCDPQAMERFVLYLYSGEVEILDQANMLNLFYIADKYNVEQLKEEYCDFIKKSLSLTNICEVIQFALSNSDSSLLDSAAEYFGNNVLDILHSVEWQSFLKNNSDVANKLLIKYFEKSKT